MPDKFTVLCDSVHYQTVTERAVSGARTKGDALLVGGILCIPFDNYLAGADNVLVCGADMVEVYATANSSQLAASNFTLNAKVYWDDTAKKITMTSSGNTVCGRALEAKDLSGGVTLGNTLRIWLFPNP
jgi:hypothetical protein